MGIFVVFGYFVANGSLCPFVKHVQAIQQLPLRDRVYVFIHLLFLVRFFHRYILPMYVKKKKDYNYV